MIKPLIPGNAEIDARILMALIDQDKLKHRDLKVMARVLAEPCTIKGICHRLRLSEWMVRDSLKTLEKYAHEIFA